MMAHFWQAVQTFFLGLGTKYGVNPWVFGAVSGFRSRNGIKRVLRHFR